LPPWPIVRDDDQEPARSSGSPRDVTAMSTTFDTGASKGEVDALDDKLLLPDAPEYTKTEGNGCWRCCIARGGGDQQTERSVPTSFAARSIPSVADGRTRVPPRLPLLLLEGDVGAWKKELPDVVQQGERGGDWGSESR
jgi:hypothetical protein